MRSAAQMSGPGGGPHLGMCRPPSAHCCCLLRFTSCLRELEAQQVMPSRGPHKRAGTEMGLFVGEDALASSLGMAESPSGSRNHSSRFSRWLLSPLFVGGQTSSLHVVRHETDNEHLSVLLLTVSCLGWYRSAVSSTGVSVTRVLGSGRVSDPQIACSGSRQKQREKKCLTAALIFIQPGVSEAAFGNLTRRSRADQKILLDPPSHYCVCIEPHTHARTCTPAHTPAQSM